MQAFVPRLILTSTAAVATLVVSIGQLNPSITSAAPDSGAHGRAIPPAHATRVDPHQLPTLAPTGDTPQQMQAVPRRYPVDLASFEKLKKQAAADADKRDHGSQEVVESSVDPQFATLSSTTTGGWNPPDGSLAVGPTSVLVGANEAFGIYDRNGNLLVGPIGFQSFFRESASASVYDPRALYDAGNSAGYNGGHGRFVLLATDGSNFTLAVSQNETPESSSSVWCSYQIPAISKNANGSIDWVDYPSLGMDGDNLYLTSNQFSNADNSFQYPRLMVVPKASVYPNASTGACASGTGAVDFTTDATGAPLLQNPGGGAAFTVQPASQPDAMPGQGGTTYLVNSIWSSGSNVVVRAVTTGASGSSPTLGQPNWVTNGWVAPYTLPASAPQPSTSNRIDTGDDRLLGATYRYGSIFTANTTGTVSSQIRSSPNAYANVQWYRITPTSATTSTASSGAVTNSSVAYFFPGILPVCSTGPTCTSPKVALELTASGRSQAASAARVVNGSVALFAKGVGGYTQYGRWGDYPAVAADPKAAGTAWLYGEYARSTTTWGTAVTNVTP